MEEHDHTTSPHKGYSAKNTSQNVKNTVYEPWLQQGAKNNIQGQLCNEFGDKTAAAAILNNTFFQSLIITIKT